MEVMAWTAVRTAMHNTVGNYVMRRRAAQWEDVLLCIAAVLILVHCLLAVHAMIVLLALATSSYACAAGITAQPG